MLLCEASTFQRGKLRIREANKAHRRLMSGVVTIRYTSEPSSDLNTAHVPEYRP